MKNIFNNKINKKFHFLPLYVYISYLFICTLLFTGLTFSGYISESYGKDEAVVAGCYIITEGDNRDALIECGDGKSNSYIYRFSVNSESEVALEYDIMVDLGENLPEGLTMKLDDKNYSDYIDGKYVFENVDIFKAEENKKYDHNLIFNVNSENNIDTSLNVSVLVYAQQID